MDVVAKYPVENGGTIELIYTQYYAPTIMACARDFWTLRYTSILDDGSFVVCEQSISGSNGAPSSPVALEFVRGRMLVSGYLIRPCERGSTIDLLDHLDLEALHFIEHVGNETNGKQIPACHEDPAFLRSVSRRLCRGFNDAVNCFSEDGWTLMNVNASDDIIMSIMRTASFGVGANYDSIICVKASLLLQELEVIRFERSADQQHVSSGDLYHLQVITGMNDMGFGACSELIFAPIDRTIPDDAALLCSGFRIFLLGSKTGEDTGSLNIAPNDALNARNAQAAISHPLSMLIVAFQFPSEADLQEDVAAMARQYVKSVISSVKNISLRTMSSGSNPVMHSHEANPAMGLKITPESSYFADLADLMCQSYRSSLGVDMVGFNCESTDSMLEQIHHHHYAILCFSFMGYAILPPGNCLSVTNRCVSYAQAVVWKVLAPDGSVHCLALALIDWSFV
ncbi:Homeobox-leucine zipper protein REVOLUTA [Sesamum angolense]|uniref:Homeobox-leucine zipper protein REVOLUTA n=1 Tax=Sesamum angolense TaxID=2727404 RepID=A0AAE1X255_9LAMI|nr:Homeobox-leucine zipper protein REVOLUTA [Sesamum angolense]